MNRYDDPLMFQHLTLGALGAEALAGWREVAQSGTAAPGQVPLNTSTTGSIGRDTKAQPRPRFAGSALLSLALMFSGNGQADCGILAVPDSVDGGDAQFASAMQHYEDTRWDLAYIGFALAAAEGHRDAARMAWQMWRYGPELFDTHFPASPQQRLRWLTAWRGPESPVSARLTRR